MEVKSRKLTRLGVLSSFPDLYFSLSNQVVMKKNKRLNPFGLN